MLLGPMSFWKLCKPSVLLLLELKQTASHGTGSEDMLKLKQTVSQVTRSEDHLKVKWTVSQVTESDELLKLKKTFSHVIGSEDLLELKEMNTSIALAHKLKTSLCILMSVLTASFNHLAYC